MGEKKENISKERRYRDASNVVVDGNVWQPHDALYFVWKWRKHPKC